MAAVVCVLLSCAHYPKNTALKIYDDSKGYRYLPVGETPDQDRLFVVLAFSGGGTRAAAFSYGVLKELENTSLPNKNGQTMLDEVDLISSVSGGSFTAAYYGLYKKKIFEDFEKRFLNRDIQGELAHMLYNPANWFKLASPYFSRIDMAAELYNDTIFGQKTFQSIVSQGRHPYIAINATNMTTGSQFTFTQSQFDMIGSDLSKFTLARAVAASSAFPFLLSPVSMANHPDPDGFELPQDIQNGLKDFGINDRRYFWAKHRAEYQANKAEHPYLHLMDGGLADNLGLRYIIDEYARTSGLIFQRKSRIKHLVVIVVNAKTEPPETLDMEAKSPGIKDVAFKTATVSMDNYSFETVQAAKELLTTSIKAQQNINACKKLLDKYCGAGHKIPTMGQGFKIHFIDINFLKVQDPDLKKTLLSLPTTFSLKPDEIQTLIDTGATLLRESEVYQALLRKLSQRR
jgi:NTE family protein